MTNEKIPSATPSASVILAREGDDGLEVLMVRRHPDTAFGSADVFPGGRLSADDGQVHALCDGIDAADANRRLNLAASGKPVGLDFYSAAIRELFEEVGVLLARCEPSHDIVATDDETLVPQRIELVEGKLTWPQFLRERNLVLAADTLHYTSHWEAPIDFRPRFSTRFFVGVAPPGQQIRCDGREIVDSRWVSPSRALSMGRNGDLNLAFPTLKHVESLAEFSSLAELMDWARDRWKSGIPMIRGVRVTENGKLRTLLPGDSGYPEDEA
jgi:8-oxo-dGTP pyrophosphatase MutT (NUDIX family)